MIGENELTKTQVLHAFWSQFGLKAYEQDSVPTGENAPQFPYITYAVSEGAWGDVLPMAASLWYRDSTWANINRMAEHIGYEIGLGGKVLHYNGGVMWITRGSLFSQSLGDPNDDLIKRKLLNVNVEFISAN